MMKEKVFASFLSTSKSPSATTVATWNSPRLPGALGTTVPNRTIVSTPPATQKERSNP